MQVFEEGQVIPMTDDRYLEITNVENNPVHFDGSPAADADPILSLRVCNGNGFRFSIVLTAPQLERLIEKNFTPGGLYYDERRRKEWEEALSKRRGLVYD